MQNESSTKLVPGALIAGKYRLLRPIGEGGMGTVWAARNESTLGKVAIKLLARIDDLEIRRRFEREARAGAVLKHRHILDVYDMGHTERGEPFLVMQLLSGRTLLAQIKGKCRLDPVEAATIGRDVARALSAAHAVNIVHRDLKPANVFLHQEPGERTSVVKVLDFGIAKHLVPLDDLQTVIGCTLGSLPYMSPEQARGDRDVDHRTDIWALGVLLFLMLTGVRPFHGDPRDLLEAILKGKIPSILHYAWDVDAEIARIVTRCMRRAREDRPGSAAEVAHMLERFIAAEAPRASAPLPGRGLDPSLPYATAVPPQQPPPPGATGDYATTARIGPPALPAIPVYDGWSRLRRASSPSMTPLAASMPTAPMADRAAGGWARNWSVRALGALGLMACGGAVTLFVLPSSTTPAAPELARAAAAGPVLPMTPAPAATPEPSVEVGTPAERAAPPAPTATAEVERAPNVHVSPKRAPPTATVLPVRRARERSIYDD